jgi:hypothetical protein
LPRLPPLAQRLSTDFGTDARFDNPRAVQIRLPGFDHAALVALGHKVRDLYAAGSDHGDRVRSVVDDPYIGTLADAVAGAFGGRVGIAPRVFLKKLVADVLDRVDQFEDFDPRVHYALTVDAAELSDVAQHEGVVPTTPRPSMTSSWTLGTRPDGDDRGTAIRPAQSDPSAPHRQYSRLAGTAPFAE